MTIKNEFIVDRVDKIHVFRKGDYVTTSVSEGRIAGIRHSEGKFRLEGSGQWFLFAYAHHADPPVLLGKRMRTVPLSTVLDNPPEGGWGEEDKL